MCGCCLCCSERSELEMQEPYMSGQQSSEAACAPQHCIATACASAHPVPGRVLCGVVRRGQLVLMWL